MDRCRNCQAQLLDYLYDLLDEPDQILLEAHLSGCAACQSALVQAQQQQNLLAAAARFECLPASFEAPADEPAPLEEPAVIPMPRPVRAPRRAAWAWVAAAAVLFLVGGLGLYAHRDHAAARAAVADLQQDTQQQAAELAALYARQDAIEKHRHESLDRLARQAREADLHLQATGPQVLVGKDTAPFRVAVRDLQGQPVAAEVHATLERRNAEGDRLDLVREEGDAFRLPAGARLAPGDDYQVAVHAERPGGAALDLAVPVEVAGPQFVTHLTTDRPLYEAGTDVVHFRSLTLDRRTLRPASEDLLLQYVLTMPGGRDVLLTEGIDKLRQRGNDDLLRGPDGRPLRGIGAGSFPLEATLPAGEYTLTVRDLRERIAPTRTRFLVRKASAVRLESSWVWHRPTYHAGAVVVATPRLVRAGGEPFRSRPVSVSLLANGQPVGSPQALRTDPEGRLVVQTRLPEGEAVPAVLVLSLRDGPSLDEIRLSVPVHLPGAVVEFYPEGGDLVAGLPARVYFQARDRRGRPVSLAGELLEDGQRIGVPVRTAELPELGTSSGLGTFRFTPKPGKHYSVRVAVPEQTPVLTLPPVLADGVVLGVDAPVCEAGQPLRIRVHTPSPRALQATLTCRGQVLEVVRLAPGETQATFTTRAARGVCRVTVHEELRLQGVALPAALLAAALAGHADSPLAAVGHLLAGSWQRTEVVPRAERLVFCRPTERLDIDLRSDRLAYKPGETAKLSFSAVDESRRSIPAIAQVAVVDRAALVGADEQFARSLPAQAWLATELRSPELLERADALLLPASASRQALDLVLATQGWRHFVPATDGPVDEERLVVAQATTTADPAALARDRAAIEAVAAEQTAGLDARVAATTATLATLESDRAAAEARLLWYQENAPHLRRGLLLALAVLLIVPLLVALGQVLLAELRRAPPWLALATGAAACLVLALTVTPPTPLAVERVSLPERRLAEVRKPNQEPVAKELLGRGLLVLDDLARNENAEKAAETKEFAQRGGAGRPGKEAQQGGDQGGVAGRAFLGRGKSKMSGSPLVGGFGALGRTPPPEQGKADFPLGQAGQAPGAGANLMRNEPRTSAGAALDRQNQSATAAELLREELLAEKKTQEVERLKDKTATLAEQEQELRQRVLVVRDFANARRKQGEARVLDTPPTVFWHPVLLLPGSGATVEFQLGTSPTRYRIDVQAHSLDGRVGNVRKDLETTGSEGK